jgi:hypothetical protein
LFGSSLARATGSAPPGVDLTASASVPPAAKSIMSHGRAVAVMPASNRTRHNQGCPPLTYVSSWSPQTLSMVVGRTEMMGRHVRAERSLCRSHRMIESAGRVDLWANGSEEKHDLRFRVDSGAPMATVPP